MTKELATRAELLALGTVGYQAMVAFYTVTEPDRRCIPWDALEDSQAVAVQFHARQVLVKQYEEKGAGERVFAAAVRMLWSQLRAENLDVLRATVTVETPPTTTEVVRHYLNASWGRVRNKMEAVALVFRR